MTALITLAAVLLDALLGEPRRWHPLVGFGRWARYFERWLNTSSTRTPLAQRLLGVFAVTIAVGPWVLLVMVASALPVLHYWVAIAALYFALGHQSLRQHALRVHRALDADNLDEARVQVGYMVSRDTAKMDTRAVASAAVESVLENGNDAVFGALFWFLVAGAPGVLLFRLSNTLDAMWGYRTPRYLYFGWTAARLDDVLNFVPARLTALTYALIGKTGSALRCWRLQAPAWDSPNAGPVMAAGAGALELGLGGGAYYHGQWEERPPLGMGSPPNARSIYAALKLVRSGVVLWLLLVIAWEIVAYA
ncbi:MAG: Cobalamin biosynthesis protein CobD [Gammaproteobacteria bacterium]|nr:Cobalamin biosynthesis protein CobD [Gammaproteobacteria bacterium]